MKKLLLTLGSALASLVLVSFLMTTTTSCKKDDAVTPTTITGTTTSFSFVTSLSGTDIIIYSNVSDHTPIVGSFFNFTTGGVSTWATASATGSNFRITDTGNATVPSLNFANTYTDGKTSSDITLFASVSGITFSTVAATDVNAITDPTAETIAIQSGTTYVFKTASGWKGILYVSSVNADKVARIGARTEAEERATQSLTFSYKIITKN